MKLFVGNLPWSVDDDKLKSLFEKYGEIEDFTVITDKFSRRSKGFGFVTFANDENAKKAISEMNEKEVDGRKIVVNEAKPLDPDRPRRSFGDREGGFRRRF
jgi:RNA recognition motif-containing protein